MELKYTESIYYQIKLTEKLCKLLCKQIEERLELPISIDEITVLKIIKAHNGEIHQRDLAKMIFKDRANTGKLLNNLETEGYITRTDVTKNKRQAKIMKVTKKGEDILETMKTEIEPIFATLEHRTSEDDRQVVIRYLQNVRDVITETIEINI